MIQIRNDYQSFIFETHTQNTASSRKDIIDTLQEIKKNIISHKNKALCDYTKKFDLATISPDSLFVTPQEIEEAYKNVPEAFITAIKKAHHNISNFHNEQKPSSWEKSPQSGVRYGMQYSPINSVGLYVPGGRAPYPSTVLMDAIPAQIAGVPNIIMTTPPSPEGKIPSQILVAADTCGVKKILKAGGSQAIFALAYGTETIPKVNKIVGPGNIYVDLAKQMIYGHTDIDKPAGPSDVLVYCDTIEYAPFAAAELLAQLEHDPLSVGIGVSSDITILNEIKNQIEQQLPSRTRNAIIAESLKNSALLLVPQNHSISVLNEIAPEHLVLLTDDHEAIRKQITSAGAIFCGPYTPVTLGDYYAGPNHVLPTSGTARFASPLSVTDFIKFSTHLTYNKDALIEANNDLKALTEMEGFEAHYAAVSCRIKQ